MLAAHERCEIAGSSLAFLLVLTALWKIDSGIEKVLYDVSLDGAEASPQERAGRSSWRSAQDTLQVQRVNLLHGVLRDAGGTRRHWDKLSAFPPREQCRWVKDKYELLWQIVPAAMNEMLEKGAPEQLVRITQAFLKMKKLNIAELQKAFDDGHASKWRAEQV